MALGVVRRNAAAIAAGVLLAAVPAGVAAGLTSSAGIHSWHQVGLTSGVTPSDPAQTDLEPAGSNVSQAPGGVTVAAAALAGLVATLSLMLALMIVSRVAGVGS